MIGQQQSPTAASRSPGSTSLHLEVGLHSHPGPSRELNEDYADYRIPKDEAELQSKGALFVVADGMGGYQAGEVASREAVKTVLEVYYADPSPEPGACLRRALRVANERLYAHSSSDPSKSGMGTTLVAAAIVGSAVFVANVGDSRAYGISKDAVIQITRDHSWVREQIEAGVLTTEQAQSHPQRNLITRALGRKQAVKADLFEGNLQAGDALLLCTDGVCGILSEDQMAQAVRSLSPTRAVAQLVTRAAAEGGKDNATALVVRAAAARTRPEQETRPSARRASPDQREKPVAGALPADRARRRWLVGGASAGIVLCLLAAVVFVPALAQKLTGDPVAAPVPAPLQDSRMAGSTIDQVALFLGYTDSAQMLAEHGGGLNPASLGASDLWPAVRGLFLVGTAREWECAEQECSFQIDMAGTRFAVTYRTSDRTGIDLDGRQVRVFGTQDRDDPTVVAQLIELGNHWWAWWKPAWKLVHQAGSWDQSAWVYSIVDRNPNGLVYTDQIQGLEQGARLLLHGLWQLDTQSLTFYDDQVYTLQGTKYVPLTGQPSLPLPTVTLQPTRAVYPDHDNGSESASSGK